MLRSTTACLNYRARLELDRIRGLLRGRARLERKVGLKRLFFLMRMQTSYRVEMQSYWERAIVRKNVDSAAREHGSSWTYLRNDLARQNIVLQPRMQQMLAQYEPLSFRAVVELCSSRVPPPPSPPLPRVPEEAYALRSADPHVAHPAARRELLEGVERILDSPSAVLRAKGPASADEWVNAWKEYDTASQKK